MYEAGPNPISAGPEQTPKPSGWRLFLPALWDTGIFKPEEWPVKKLIGSAVAITAAVFAVAILSHGVAHVHENEVGVLADNLRGELDLKERVGYHFFIPYAANFYVLDKTIQKLNLTWDQGPGGAPGRDVKLKTADGNNVSIDISVNYKLMPEQAVKVLRESGLGMRFAETWVEPYVLQCCLSSFGQLTTEQLYDAAKRNEMAQLAQKEINEKLNPQGIEIIAVIPGDFRFYKDYEQLIQEKKLADQKVEEQQAQGRAAMEDQERQMVEARKKAETHMTVFEGESTNRMIQAQAEAAKIRREADGQSRFTILQADAALYTTTQQATGRKAALLADAEGMAALRQAMSGDGGVTMVGLEYARRLGNIHFAGTAITKQPTIQQLSVQPAEAAAASAPVPATPAQGGGR